MYMFNIRKQQISGREACMNPKDTKYTGYLTCLSGVLFTYNSVIFRPIHLKFSEIVRVPFKFLLNQIPRDFAVNF